MSSQPTGDQSNPPAPTSSNRVLLSAWALFFDFDQESVNQKQLHVRRRTVVIYLGLVLSILAVVYASTGETTIDFVRQVIRPVLQGFLIVLPVFLGILMTRASQIPPKDWATCRVAAELYRREIYLFRMNAGAYRNSEGRALIFAEQLKQVSAKIQKYGTPSLRGESAKTIQAGTVAPGSTPIDNPDLIKEKIRLLRGKPEADDGFSPMTGQQYIDLRLKSQMDYYDKKAVQDLNVDDRWTLVSSIIAAAGSLLALYGPTAPFVAVTGAISTTIGLRMNLNLIGKTNAIYRWTYQQLRLADIKWTAILDTGKQDDPIQIAEIVEEVENIFQSERETWMERVIQSTEIVEGTLAEKYTRLKSETKPGS